MFVSKLPEILLSESLLRAVNGVFVGIGIETLFAGDRVPVYRGIGTVDMRLQRCRLTFIRYQGTVTETRHGDCRNNAADKRKFLDACPFSLL